MLMYSFIGSFNKIKNHRDCEYCKDEYGMEYHFDHEAYKKVSLQIKTLLGNKEKYTGQEAFRFFQKQFAAFPIDIHRYFDYIGITSVGMDSFVKYNRLKDSDFLDLEGFEQFYSFLGGKEKNLVFVIDTVNNTFLQDKYPEIEEFKKKQINRMQHYGRVVKEIDGWWLYTNEGKTSIGGIERNIIIAIGSFDGTTINSMKTLSGSGQLADVEYALEFFRLHS